MIRNSNESWGWPARALHWIVAAMLLWQYGHGLWMEDMPRDAVRSHIWLHSAIGISLLAIAVLAFAWWLFNAVPAEPAATPEWQKRASRIAQWTIYALIFAVAMSGWALNGTLREPIGVDLFGVIGMPQLTAPGSGAHEFLEEAHEILANVLIAVVALHVAAALYHHFVLRDAVLLRMLGRKPVHEGRQ
jgi:cytochrome b561